MKRTNKSPLKSMQNLSRPGANPIRRVPLWMVCSLAILLAGCRLPTGPGTRKVESSPHVLIARTATAEGIRRTDKFLTIENQPGELIWLTGATLSATASDKSVEPVLSRASVVLKNIQRYGQLHSFNIPLQGLLFRFSTDNQRIEFPKGYGIPINSNEPLLLGTESRCGANPASPARASFGLDLDYLRDRGLSTHPTALYCVQLNSLVTVGGRPRYYGVATPDPQSQGEGTPNYPPATTERFTDGVGGTFADMWYCGPGDQENRTYASTLLSLTRDTRIHAAMAHMMPHGSKLELYDLTAAESVLEFQGKGDLPAFQPMQSSEGVFLHREHQYELRATFHNPQSTAVKAGAQMMLYLEAPKPLKTP